MTCFRLYDRIALGAIAPARMSGPNTRSPAATKSLLIAGGVAEIGNGLAQRGFNRPRRVAEFALGFFDRKGRRAPRDPHTFGRSRGRLPRDVIGDKLQHSRGGFRNFAGNGNEEMAAT